MPGVAINNDRLLRRKASPVASPGPAVRNDATFL